MSEFRYTPPRSPVEIIYKDQSIVVVNKPAGLLSVPGKPQSHFDCMFSRLQKEVFGIRVVHRLDLDTSGVMIFARTPSAQANLGKQFEAREIKKIYLAKVSGLVEKDSDIIKLPITIDWPNRPKQKICFENGRMASTKYLVLERNEDHTLVQLIPITGRSHQLRVHMQSLGHPILGDTLYGLYRKNISFTKLKRMYLHSEKIRLSHPKTLKNLTFHVPCPFK